MPAAAKFLSRAGIASRRDAEALIEAGKVRMNNEQVTHPAVFVQPGDLVVVDGKAVSEPERTRLWRYHKPDGLVTTHKDPEGRATVFEHLPAGLPRVISIGRLDLTSEGLLLLTNDGALSRQLELPSMGWLRRYRVRVHGGVDPKKLVRLAEGITTGHGASVFGSGAVSSLEHATFANTTMLRLLDYNDAMILAGGCHPSDVIPALIAAGQYAARRSLKFYGTFSYCPYDRPLARKPPLKRSG